MLSGSSPHNQVEEDAPQTRNVVELGKKSKKVGESNDVLDLMMGNTDDNDRHNLDDFLDDCTSIEDEVATP